MLVPILLPWMKEWRDLASIWINASQIGAFMEITFWARQGEVGEFVGSPMLSGDNVLDVKA